MVMSLKNTLKTSSANRVSDVNNPYMFTGRRFDPETALYYYRARYYAPDIGRFLQTDPIGYARTSSNELSVPAFKVDKVVDTLGAGDAFVAGFLAGMVNVWELEKACRFANAVGACCVSAEGASGIRPMQEIMKLYPLGV